MKNYVRFLAIVLSAAVMFAAPVLAEDANKAAAAGKASGGDRVAVLDIEAVMTRSDAAKKILTQLDGKRESYKKEFVKREKEMKTRYDELAKQKSTLSEADFNKKREVFEKDVLDAQRDVQERIRKLEKSYAESMTSLQKEVNKVVEKFAEEEKIGMIFSRSQIVVVNANLDITKIIMDRVNKEVKSVPVNLPK